MGWDAHTPVNSAFLGKTEKHRPTKMQARAFKIKIMPAGSSYTGIDMSGDKG